MLVAAARTYWKRQSSREEALDTTPNPSCDSDGEEGSKLPKKVEFVDQSY